MSEQIRVAGRSVAPGDRPEAINAQLERILNSVPFAQADQLRRFLAFIVGEVIDGRGAALKEHVIAVRVLHKDATFDPRTDPIVRVQARRLRAKLERYYHDEGVNDPLIIELPRGGYAPAVRPRKVSGDARRPITSALLGRNTVAVVPLMDLSTGATLAGVGEGARAEIIQRVTRLPGVRIINASAPADHAATQAAVVIGGSLRAAGDRVRLSLHVLDGATNTFLWADSFDGPITDPFAMQEHAAEALAHELAAELTAVDGPHPSRPAENLAARNFYLQGRYHLNQRTEEGLRHAVEYFERAIVEDERYALAHSGLSDAYGLLGHYGVLGPANVWTKTASLAASAVLLDDRCAEAHTSLAHVRATQDWDWDGAEREFLRAVSLNPRYATAHHWYAASYLAPLGRLEEALDEMRVAQALDPISAIVARDVAVIHFYRKAFDTALEQCDHTVELNPHFAPAYVTLGLIQEQREDFDESTAAFQRALQLAPGTPRILAALARNVALAGHRGEASETLEQLIRLSADRYVSPLDLAWVSFALDDTDAGYQWLTKAFADRAFDVISVHVDPRFDSLRGDVRFQQLAAQLHIRQ